ncbi:MAG: hypothetical protein DCC71_14080 [Proteobacteria bacterium]|nr:MAG: hypothetical protein DCC71_14080 [Pseudomonadota bacterium]
MSDRESAPRAFAPPVVVWALVLGAIGFVCGFFGPIALAPEANQGPLLGIFITGPGGFVLGLVVGVVLRTARVPVRRQWQALAATSALLAAATLVLATPPPRRLGRIVDAEVAGCESADARAAQAVERWQTRIAEVTWAEPRDGWRDGVAQMLAREPGVVVELRVLRRRELSELRKPWNAGRLDASAWEAAETREAYWLPQADASCDAALAAPRGFWLPTSQTERSWPPERLPNFLGLMTLAPVPAQYAAFLDR